MSRHAIAHLNSTEAQLDLPEVGLHHVITKTINKLQMQCLFLRRVHKKAEAFHDLKKQQKNKVKCSKRFIENSLNF